MNLGSMCQLDRDGRSCDGKLCNSGDVDVIQSMRVHSDRIPPNTGGMVFRRLDGNRKNRTATGRVEFQAHDSFPRIRGEERTHRRIAEFTPGAGAPLVRRPWSTGKLNFTVDGRKRKLTYEVRNQAGARLSWRLTKQNETCTPRSRNPS